MDKNSYSIYSETQQGIDQQQAEIRAINQREAELEAARQTPQPKVSRWKRLLGCLYR